MKISKRAERRMKEEDNSKLPPMVVSRHIHRLVPYGEEPDGISRGLLADYIPVVN